MNQDPVVIVAAARTPMGAFQGAFSSVSAVELGAVATRLALQQSGLGSDDIDELLFGCVLPAGLLQAPARQVALAADLPLTTQCSTINKVCGSGMKTTMLAHDQILAGSCEIAVSGGMENMTQSPYFIAKARGGLRLGHGEIKDHMFCDGLEDAYSGRLMGSFAQQTADQFDISREQMDNYAIESLTRAQAAIANGYFDAEIAPVTVKTRKGTITVSVDEQPGNAKIDKIPKLKPAFAKDGTVTAANSSSISDGAAALVLMKQSRAEALGLKPIARIVAHASHARHPSEFTLAPVGAMDKVLDAANWSIDEVDLFEINEAFAMVTLLAIQELNLDPAKVNINGGACALGHPLGASGARILVTLIYALKRLNKQRGVASLCIGGGEATAMAIEII